MISDLNLFGKYKIKFEKYEWMWSWSYNKKKNVVKGNMVYLIEDF